MGSIVNDVSEWMSPSPVEAPMVSNYQPAYSKPPEPVPVPPESLIGAKSPTSIDYSKPLFNPKPLGNSYEGYKPLVTELKNRGYDDEKVKNILWNLAAESSGKANATQNGTTFGGKGFVQLTGEANYKDISKRLNDANKNNTDWTPIDLVKNPKLASDPKYSALIAAEYFDMRAERASKKKGELDRSIYDSPVGVIKALAPRTVIDYGAEKAWQMRLEQNLKNKWFEPGIEDYKSRDAEVDNGYYSTKGE